VRRGKRKVEGGRWRKEEEEEGVLPGKKACGSIFIVGTVHGE
jgi:hypothetical protein